MNGGSFTVYCILETLIALDGSITEMFHISTNGTVTELQPKLSEEFGHSFDHYFVIRENVSESSKGEYVCRFTMGNYNSTKSVTIHTSK